MASEFDPERFTPAQIAELRASAISPEIAERAGVYSVSDPKAAAKLFGRSAKEWEAHGPVLVYPYKIPFHRDPVLVRGKPARPFEQPKRDGSVALVKYVQAKNTGVHIAFGPSLLSGPALRDTSTVLLITEGEKKMLAAESAGFSCIALPGVSQWHAKGLKDLHPYFAHAALRDRVVCICFDADALANKDVRREELALARALEAVGAIACIVRFPQDAPKLDDYLATHELTEFAALIEDAKKNGRPPPDTTGPTSEEWAKVFEHLRLDPETGLPVKDVDTLSRVLLYHPAWDGCLRFDARRERQIFTREPPFAADIAVSKGRIPRPLTDTDAARIADWFVHQRELGWTTQPKVQQVEQAIAMVCERNRFDGVRDYLTSLPAWDGTPRLDTMAATYFGAKDTVYTRTVFAKWMLSAVARAREPGCQVDHVLVLEGEQGIGKSTALRVLAGDEWFSDTLPDISSKDAHEHCIGPWIIELAELDHARKSEVTALKAFLSARAPAFRSAYARRTAEHPRRCVFCATTNESGYLPDATGNRRFWPIECTRADVDELRRDRDQLWAEALHRVRAGEAWHLTDPTVQGEAAEEQAARRQVDPWHETVSRFVRRRQHVTVGDVLDHLGEGPDEQAAGQVTGFGSYTRPTTTGPARGRGAWRYDQRAANRVAAILRDLGWTRKMVRHEGFRVWRYESPTGRVTGLRDTGDTVETGQVYDIKGKSPPSPLSPVDPLCNTYARADVRAPAGVPPAPSSPSTAPLSVIALINNSGDSGDSSDSVEKSAGYPGTTLSPPPQGTGDTPSRPRRRL